MGTAAIISLSAIGVGLIGGGISAWRHHRLMKWAQSEGIAHLEKAALVAIKASQDAKAK